MKRGTDEIWLFSQHPGGPGGTNAVVNEAKKALTQARIAFHHVWITNFSAKFHKENRRELYFKALPLPVYLNNLLAGLKWRRKLTKPHVALVLGGGPASGAIPFAANIPYGMWIGTTLLDEYKIRNIKEELFNRSYSILLNKLFLDLNRIIEYFVLKKAQFIIVQSPYMIKSIKEDYNIEREKLEYLPYPITLKDEIKNRSFNRRRLRLLAVGRVDDNRKNFPFLLEAFRILIKKYPGSSLRIVGEISVKSNLLKKCGELKLNSFVNFLGKISIEELTKEYKNADIFVLSPRQEGLGIVYLEAMSYGLPVVTTRCGGPEGIVIDGINGCLVDQNNPRAFSKAIQMVWSSENKYKKLSNQARNYILEMHDPEKFSRRFIEILRNKLGY